MKNRIHLLDDFRDILRIRIPCRAELVRQVAEILNVERESVSRRLNGNVNFSVDEVGKLAKELDISLDSLLTKNKQLHWRRYILEKPSSATSLDEMAERIEQHLDRYDEIRAKKSEFGFLYTTPPIDLFISYPYLSKFMLFKWGHYYIDSSDFYDYVSWQTPERFTRIKVRFIKRPFDDGKIINIWDDAMIWTLCREIQNFYIMHTLLKEHVDYIRNEMHEMLSAHEAFVRKDTMGPENKLRYSFYISNIHIGLNCWYHMSDKEYMSYIHSNFIRTDISNNPEGCLAIRDWILSLRKISSLLSGTGQKERRIFYEEQHKIIDLLLRDRLMVRN